MTRPLTFSDVRSRLAGALSLDEHHRVEPAPEVTCRHVPAWVGEYGVARLGAVWLLYVARAEGAQPDAMGQAVLDVPAGRYLVDTYDVAERNWRTLESAAAPPLVIGVPRCDHAIVVRVRAVASLPLR